LRSKAPMGKTYPTTGVCGFEGKICQLKDYPQCDEMRMIGARPLPGTPPEDDKELAKWVDRWVESVKNIGGICKYASGAWGIYSGNRPSLLSSAQRSSEPQPQPESQPASQPVFQPESQPVSPAAVDEPSAPLQFIKSIQEFGAGLIPEDKKKDVGIYGGIAAGALLFLVVSVSSYVIYKKAKNIDKILKANKPQKVVPPVVAKDPVNAEAVKSPNLKTAQLLQLMLAVHKKKKGTPEYDEKSSTTKLRTMMEVGKENSVELADLEKVQVLVMEYDALLGQIDGLKIVNEGMAGIDSHKLAQSVLLKKHLMLIDGNWTEFEAKFRPGGSELMGPVPPELIQNMVKDGSWADPFAPAPQAKPSSPAPAPAPAPAAAPAAGAEPAIEVVASGAPRGDESSDFGPTRANSAFWTDLLESDWFQGMDDLTKEIILGNHETIQKALHLAYKDPAFKERHVPVGSKKISDAGMHYVVVETLNSRKVNTRQAVGLAGLARPDEKAERGWLERYRKDLPKALLPKAAR